MTEEKIYTKTGDRGNTNLFDFKGVSKAHLRVEAYGTIDELNSMLGLCKHYVKMEGSKEAIEIVQRKLFDVGAELATLDVSILKTRIDEEDIETLEGWIDEILKDLETPMYFILPGDNKQSAYLHVARTVCRRAERVIVSLMHQEEVNEKLLKYVNRLSDWIYALSRKEEHHYEKVIF